MKNRIKIKGINPCYSAELTKDNDKEVGIWLSDVTGTRMAVKVSKEDFKKAVKLLDL